MPWEQFSKVLLPATVRLVRPTLPGSPHPRCGTKPMAEGWLQGSGWICRAPLVGPTAVGWGGSQPPLPKGRKREPRGLPRSSAGTLRSPQKQCGWVWAHSTGGPVLCPLRGGMQIPLTGGGGCVFPFGSTAQVLQWPKGEAAARAPALFLFLLGICYASILRHWPGL